MHSPLTQTQCGDGQKEGGAGSGQRRGGGEMGDIYNSINSKKMFLN